MEKNKLYATQHSDLAASKGYLTNMFIENICQQNGDKTISKGIGIIFDRFLLYAINLGFLKSRFRG